MSAKIRAKNFKKERPGSTYHTTIVKNVLETMYYHLEAQGMKPSRISKYIEYATFYRHFLADKFSDQEIISFIRAFQSNNI